MSGQEAVHTQQQQQQHLASAESTPLVSELPTFALKLRVADVLNATVIITPGGKSAMQAAGRPLGRAWCQGIATHVKPDSLLLSDGGHASIKVGIKKLPRESVPEEGSYCTVIGPVRSNKAGAVFFMAHKVKMMYGDPAILQELWHQEVEWLSSS